MTKQTLRGVVAKADNKNGICVVRVGLEEGVEVDLYDVKLPREYVFGRGDYVDIDIHYPDDVVGMNIPEDVEVRFSNKDLCEVRFAYRDAMISEIDTRLDHIVATDLATRQFVKIPRTELEKDIRDIKIRDIISYFADFDESGELSGYSAHIKEDTQRKVA